MLIKVKNLINFIVFAIIELFIDRIEVSHKANTLLLIRLDAIGDYILFRNFIRVIKEDEKFKNYKLTLCGNIVWKDLAETFDKSYVDEFIFLDRKKFYSNLFYKYSILKKIHEKGFEIAVEATYSHEILYGDEIIKASNAKQKISSKGSLDKHSKWKRNFFTDKYYTKLLDADENNLFEFYRNKEFFEKFLEKKIENVKLKIDSISFDSLKNLPNDFIVIFPGASNKIKTWDINNYIEVIRFLIKNYSYDIVIGGSFNEQNLAAKAISEINNKKRLQNLVSKTSLTQLSEIIDKSRLLISNETMAVHLAAALGKEFICVTNGERIDRFHPYPKEIFDKGYYVYPAELQRKIKDEGIRRELWFDSNYDINEIKPEEVNKLIDKILN